MFIRREALSQRPIYKEVAKLAPQVVKLVQKTQKAFFLAETIRFDPDSGIMNDLIFLCRKVESLLEETEHIFNSCERLAKTDYNEFVRRYYHKDLRY